MGRLGKEALIQAVISPLAEAGWATTRLSKPSEHPARIKLSRGTVVLIIKLYIWNLSHGGRGRSEAEYRVQVTGLDQFTSAPEETTLVLGWDEERGVFAGFDVGARRDRLGSSPSIQIMARTLDAAVRTGAAVQAKREDEFAIAVRPDRLDRYVVHLADAHRGDISALVGEPDEVQSRLERLNVPDLVFEFNRPGDETLRMQVREQTEALLALTRSNPVPPGHIGHNGPPEAIDDEPDLQRTLEAIRADTEREAPDGAGLVRRAGFLSLISRALEVASNEAKAFVHKGKDLLREHLAKALGGFVATAIWNAREQIMALLKTLIDTLLRWLELAAGLF